MTIGTTLLNRCSFDIDKLLDAVERPATANMFYEMYLVDYDDTLVPIPVKVVNLDNGAGPNRGPLMDNWILTTRFFVAETIGGIGELGGFAEGAMPSVVRYAKNITLKLELDTNQNQNEKLFVPHLEIEYEDRKSSEVLKQDDMRITTVAFTSEYYMETSGFWSFANTFFTILIIAVAFLTMLQVFIRQRSDKLQVEAQSASMQFALIRSITAAMDIFSNIFFWYLFAMCAWWFVFFKLQQRVYCLLPALGSDDVNYHQYDSMLIALTVLKFLSLAYKIVFEQSSMDIFVIDWETPKMYRHRSQKPK